MKADQPVFAVVRAESVRPAVAAPTTPALFPGVAQQAASPDKAQDAGIQGVPGMKCAL